MFSSPPIEAEGEQVTRSCTPSPFYRVFREFQTKVRVHVRLRVRLRTVVCSLTIMYLRPTPTLRARTANHAPALNHVTAVSESIPALKREKVSSATGSVAALSLGEAEYPRDC